MNIDDCVTPTPLTDLSTAVLRAVCPERETIWAIEPGLADYDPTRSQFIWRGEQFGAWRWNVRRDGEEGVLVEVDKSSTEIDEDEKFEATLRFSCPSRDFVQVVVSILERILLKHGVVGYQWCWSSEQFPLSMLVVLKKWLIHPSAPREELFRSSWSEEMQFLGRVSGSGPNGAVDV